MLVDSSTTTKKIDLGQTITILANIGVIASLVFLGMQVRQEAAASRAATFQQLKESWVQANLAEATSVDLAQAFVSAQTQGWDSASSSVDRSKPSRKPTFAKARL